MRNHINVISCSWFGSSGLIPCLPFRVGPRKSPIVPDFRSFLLPPHPSSELSQVSNGANKATEDPIAKSTDPLRAENIKKSPGQEQKRTRRRMLVDRQWTEKRVPIRRERGIGKGPLYFFADSIMQWALYCICVQGPFSLRECSWELG